MIDQFLQNGIISAQDANNLASDKDIIFLDASFALPGSGENLYENYLQEHIPGAAFFDIESVCNKECNLPHMLPHRTIFENSMRSLGIRNENTVIVYGQKGMIMGPARLWWMLKGFGHNRVLVMDGGLPAWRSRRFKTENGNIKHTASSYVAHDFNPRRVVSLDEMITLSKNRTCPILDARPPERFSGQAPEPRAGMRSGHIPGAINIPCSTLINEDGCFKSKEELKTLFHDIDLHGRIITSCGSGITACALALALYHLGHDNTAVYDGSWSEWGRKDSPTKIINTHQEL